jgi:D-alanine transaminase
MEIGFINGTFIPINKEVVPIDERGHQFGDGVYEVIRVYHSQPFMLHEHLQRLENSATAIKIKINYSISELEQFIIEGIKKSELSDAEVYIQVTRGMARRNHLFPDVSPSTSMTIRPARNIPKEQRENGIRVMLMPDERWQNCYIKSLNLLPNILAKQEAVLAGCAEAILVRDGFVTEGSSSNIYVIKEHILYTTPLSKHILHGITRQAVLALASKIGISVVEKEMTPEFLKEGDEAFITSTSIEVLPIIAVDEHIIGIGKPGAITLKLQEWYSYLYDIQ